MHRTFCRTGLFSVIAATFAFCVSGGVGEVRAAVEPRLVGVWLRDSSGPAGQHQTLTMDIGVITGLYLFVPPYTAERRRAKGREAP